MRLLVTRPVADAQALAAELEARGHSVICAPVIEIVTKPDAAPELTNVKGLAFTSANGVRAFGPFAPVARHLPAYAVGPQTAAALARHWVYQCAYCRWRCRIAGKYHYR